MAGSIAFGLGIWAMHYIGMVAFMLPVPVLYHFPTVLLSLLVAIVASAVALHMVSWFHLSFGSSIAASVTMGGGSLMHYIGMAAMRLPAMMEYRYGLVAVSVLVGVAVSFASLLLAMRYRFDSPVRSNWAAHSSWEREFRSRTTSECGRSDFAQAMRRSVRNPRFRFLRWASS